jgi:hypothetical protein
MSEFANPFKPVTRTWVPLKIALMGVSGSGKTYGAILLARGIAGETGRIAVLDTENGRATFKSHLTKFDHVRLDAPYTVERYVQMIHGAVAAKYDVLVIDSFSHSWMGEGGLMDQKDSLDAKKRSETFGHWIHINRMEAVIKSAILNSPINIIVTMRSKMEYSVGSDNKPRKVGLGPVQRPGVEYDFSFIFDVSQEHLTTVMKDDSEMWGVGGQFQITSDHGVALRKWRDEVTITDAEKAALFNKAVVTESNVVGAESTDEDLDFLK